MSITVGVDTRHLQKHDHVRPNPSNPLVQIKRDRSAEAEAAARELELRPRDAGLASKGGKVTDLNAPTPTKASLPMPVRFQKPELWSDSAAPQHPLYRTSSHTYGERPPAIQEVQNVYYGNTHNFSSTFAGGPFRDCSLNTAVSKSRVRRNTAHNRSSGAMRISLQPDGASHPLRPRCRKRWRNNSKDTSRGVRVSRRMAERERKCELPVDMHSLSSRMILCIFTGPTVFSCRWASRKNSVSTEWRQLTA